MPALRLVNAHVWTPSLDRPVASDLALRDGHIVDDPGPDATIVDLAGATILPGLIDAHTHLSLGGLTLAQLDLSHTRGRADFEAALAQRHAELPADSWLIAHGWSEERWTPREPPDRSWLAAAEDRPTVCYRMDHHACVVNDAVLERLDLDDDPPGGEIVRDATGRPTGLLREAAAWQLVNPLVPDPTDEALRTAVRRATAHNAAFGVTTVGTMEYADVVRRAFVPQRNELPIRCRVTLLDRPWPPDLAIADTIDDDEMLAVIGFKAFADGTLGSRTARLLEDYADDPGNRGLFVEHAADGRLGEWARAIARGGYSPSIHAIGDEAARLALDAIEAVDPSVRPRIEHAQQLDATDIARFRGVIASMQPLHRADDARSIERRVGPGRLGGFFPFRSLLAAGARLAFGSDWPIVTCDPIPGIRAAVTGLDGDDHPVQVAETTSVGEALRAYTADAAFALGLDNAGQLRAGDVADVTVLDRDPFAADWAKAPPRVTMTIVAGRIVYDARRSS